MKLYKKEGNILQIISFPTENAEKGDYLLVEDADAARRLHDSPVAAPEGRAELRELSQQAALAEAPILRVEVAVDGRRQVGWRHLVAAR